MQNPLNSEQSVAIGSSKCCFLEWTSSTVKTLALVLICQSIPQTMAQISVSPLYDMSPDSNALVMGTGGNFSSTINGRPFQQDVLITHQGYQYSTWYHNGNNGADLDIYLSRRDLTGNTWETIDTGYDMERGDDNWDSHNAISMGISGDGRIHLAYDHHVHELRYLTTAAGYATSSSTVWNQANFELERNSLNIGGATIPKVTYPRFTKVGSDLAFTYRDRTSSDGDHYIANYDSQTGLWNNTHQFTDGRVGTYIDVDGNSSTKRNAYLNGLDVDNQGRMHITWTWRENASKANHDINYAYSDDNGSTWNNNADAPLGSMITLNSPGIEVVDLDIRQALINQQGQVVDSEGGVHVLMRHRRQEPGFEWQPGDGTFDSSDAAYHHYYRDPLTGVWDVNRLPVSIPATDRPKIGVDSNGHLFGIYTHSNDLVIAGAEKTASGYADWEILYRDQIREYLGTPLLDKNRLLEEGILSVFVQERAPTSHPTNPTSSPLHILEFNTITPSTPSILSGTSDGSLRQHKSSGAVSGEGLGFVINAEELNVGQSGNSADPFDRAAVMVFQLPDLGDIDDPFQTASFQGYLTQNTVTSGSIGGDLYGLARRDAPEILNSDYYGRTDVPDPNAVLLQDDFLVEDLAVDTSIFTSATGNANLIDFLNEQYAGGEGIGDYVFLRLNVDADTTKRWSLSSGNESDDARKPQLRYQALEGPPFLAGDFDLDGDVDGADFLHWQRNDGSAAGLTAWQNTYSGPVPQTASSAAVPEPNALMLIVCGIVFSKCGCRTGCDGSELKA